MSGASQPGVQSGAQAIPNAMGGNLSALLGTLKNAQTAQPAPSIPQARYYQTTLEPMQMLQAYRSGQPVVNHVFAPQPQFLPAQLPAYTPKPAQAVNPYTGLPVNYGYASGGPGGGDGSPGSASSDGGADGSGGAAGDGGGGGGGGGK